MTLLGCFITSLFKKGYGKSNGLQRIFQTAIFVVFNPPKIPTRARFWPPKSRVLLGENFCGAIRNLTAGLLDAPPHMKGIPKHKRVVDSVGGYVGKLFFGSLLTMKLFVILVTYKVTKHCLYQVMIQAPWPFYPQTLEVTCPTTFY